jgi:hypothetical protein
MLTGLQKLNTLEFTLLDDKTWNEEVLRTLTSDGWMLLEEQFKEQIETLKESLTQHKPEDLHNTTRGQIASLRYLLGYKSLVEETLEDLNENA